MSFTAKITHGNDRPSRRYHRVVASLILGISAAMLGCDSGPSLGQVTGTVTYQGKPLEKGTIVFEVPGNRTAFGKIENGQIVDVSTFKQGDGVPIGDAKIAVNAFDDGGAAAQQASPAGVNAPGGTGGMVVGKNLLPKKYSNPATSELQVTIQAGENLVELNLQP